MPVPELMAAVQLVGHGGFDKLVYSETVAIPAVRPGEVLVKVLAASINYTDINTRIGWYSSTARTSTDEELTSNISPSDGDWAGKCRRFCAFRALMFAVK
jgi:hypothetical protein